MSYQQALKKAWDDLTSISRDSDSYAVKLLSDTYTVDLKNRTVFSDSCNIPAKEYTSIIILHYLAKKLKLGSLPQPSGEWIDFRQLEGGEGYYPAFKKRTIDKILKKYGSSPKDMSTMVQALESVPMLITTSKADEEFGPAANILFDRTVSAVFCTEDIVVLTEIVVHQL